MDFCGNTGGVNIAGEMAEGSLGFGRATGGVVVSGTGGIAGIVCHNRRGSCHLSRER